MSGKSEPAPWEYDDDDRMGDPWCRDFEGHTAAHEFCADHQISWCRLCDRMCPECVDDPHCADCGCSLFTEEHNWDCCYAGEDDDEEVSNQTNRGEPMIEQTSDPRDPSDRELRIKAEMLTCKHFNGVQHDECRANVNYRKLVGEPELGCMTRIPCCFGFEPKNGPRAKCQLRVTWTREEAEQLVDAHEKAIQRHMEAFRKVHDDAKRKGFKKNHGGMGECRCPVCEGTLRYSVAAYNGHIHAKCETEGCVQWME